MHPKDVGRMANRVDPDQTAPKEQSDQNLHKEQSDQNLHCLFRNMCPNI